MAASKSSSVFAPTKTSTGPSSRQARPSPRPPPAESSADTEEADRSGGTNGLASLVEQLTNTRDQAARPRDAQPRTDPGDARRGRRARPADPQGRQRARGRAGAARPRADRQPARRDRATGRASAAASSRPRPNGAHDGAGGPPRPPAGRRARRTVGVGPWFPILGYDELDGPPGRPSRLEGPDAGGAAHGARLRAPPRQPQVGTGRDRGALVK